MKKIFYEQTKKKIYDMALRADFSLHRKVDDDRVRRLIESMHPVQTDVPLVRVGGSGDGGYLVPDELDGIVACFSPGVDVTATFESQLVQRGIRCFLADASVEKAPISDPLVDFEKKFVGVVNDDLHMTMDSWMQRKLPEGSDALLLQMDIEGAEWPVLLNMSDQALRSFRIIVLELHGLTHMFDLVAIRMFEACMARLSALFNVVHLHPNNYAPGLSYRDIEIPAFLEMTLHRKDRATVSGYAKSFPHPLDAPNVPGKPDIRLSDVFHR